MKKSLLLTTLCLFLYIGECIPENVGNLSKDPIIIKYSGFIVQYNPVTKQPNWVDYTLTAEHVEMSNNTPKISRHFMQDPNLTLPQATPADYKDSGWVRGHMARRQDMKWSEQAVKESDYYTNICPQNDVLNNGVWHQIRIYQIKQNLLLKVVLKFQYGDCKYLKRGLFRFVAL